MGDWDSAADAGEQCGWDLVGELGSRHDILPLVARAWREVEKPRVPVGLEEAATRSRLRGLRLAGEAFALTSALQSAGVKSLVLKGPPLAMLAYGSLALRDAGDVDLLIQPIDLLPALRVLLDLGYRVETDRKPVRSKTEAHWRMVAELEASAAEPTRGRVGSLTSNYMDISNEVSLRRHHVESIDLHWRLFRNRSLMPIPLPARRLDVDVCGVPIPTLDPLDHACFLAVHALVHGWDRLKWLIDIPMLLRSTRTSIDELMARASSLGVELAVLVSLHLSTGTLGWPAPDELSSFRLGRSGRWLISWAQDQLGGGSGLEPALPARKRRQVAAQVISQRGVLARLRAAEDVIVAPQMLVDWVGSPIRRLGRFTLVGTETWVDSATARRRSIGAHP